MIEHGWATANPSRSRTNLDVDMDRRRVRCARYEAEVHALLEYTAGSGMREGLTGVQRAMIYRCAIVTGLRAGELASLKVRNLTLEGERPVVSLRARSSKRRPGEVLPLRTGRAQHLARFVAGFAPSSPLFPIDKTWRSAKMPAAGFEAWQSQSNGNHARAAGRGELEGKVVDFHSLRHTLVTLLTRAGVGAKVAQAQVRHSTQLLTFGAYDHAPLGDERPVLELSCEIAVDRRSARGEKASRTGCSGGGALRHCHQH